MDLTYLQSRALFQVGDEAIYYGKRVTVVKRYWRPSAAMILYDVQVHGTGYLKREVPTHKLERTPEAIAAGKRSGPAPLA